ncbi:hypothetical protein ACFQY4_26065 [Catellatospora bangladeshensis]|uniref:hypothetical protein n=1 Tax=Catellatospora bangladeshensis TaxID=310355 RepID=UPI0036115C7A
MALEFAYAKKQRIVVPLGGKVDRGGSALGSSPMRCGLGEVGVELGSFGIE